MRWVVFSFLWVTANLISDAQAAVDPVPRGFTNARAAISSEQFALEQSPQTRLDFQFHWRTPQFEARIFSFAETGEKGDRSLDPDRLVGRLASGGNSYYWLGRAHPASEGSWNPGTENPTPTSAIGANWVQNQSNALSPRVSGWIGAGWTGNIEGFAFTAALSPLFIPTFGPRLDLSESRDASGSRFARLPPRYAVGNREPVGIRYRVDAGNIGDIVLQNQYFAALGRTTPAGRFRLLGWSAPSSDPDPVIKSEDIVLPVSGGDAQAVVPVFPRFPRKDFAAFQWASPGVRSLVSLESAYELRSGDWTASAEILPTEDLRLGVLQTWKTRPPAGAGPVVASPIYGKDLVWFEARSQFLGGQLEPSLRVEQHLTAGRQGAWVHPLLEYHTRHRWAFFTGASMIVGKENSWFGAWRSLDSFSGGARYLW